MRPITYRSTNLLHDDEGAEIVIFEVSESTTVTKEWPTEGRKARVDAIDDTLHTLHTRGPSSWVGVKGVAVARILLGGMTPGSDGLNVLQVPGSMPRCLSIILGHSSDCMSLNSGWTSAPTLIVPS